MHTLNTLKIFTQVLASFAESRNNIFSLSDLHGAMPQHNRNAFKVLVNRAEKQGLLERVCRGLYIVPDKRSEDGLLLYHAASRLRADQFNYISLESVLCDAGVISQVPLNWITVMTSGRSHIIRCQRWGSIEFIHTRKKADDVAGQLTYDSRCHMWRASVALALKDMKATKRSMDLVNIGMNDESI